jgi:hypothetical protein
LVGGDLEQQSRFAESREGDNCRRSRCGKAQAVVTDLEAKRAAAVQRGTELAGERANVALAAAAKRDKLGTFIGKIVSRLDDKILNISTGSKVAALLPSGPCS